jgi:hypothetical protein
MSPRFLNGKEVFQTIGGGVRRRSGLNADRVMRGWKCRLILLSDFGVRGVQGIIRRQKY